MLKSLLTAAVLVSASAAAAQTRVAIVAAANFSVDSRYTDPQAKLQGTGDFAAVDIIAVTGAGSTPTLATLLGYDAVIVWSNVDFADEAGLGDVLADYVDAGGGVVVAVFANTSTDPDRSLKGRWDAENYHIVPPAGGATTGRATLGDVLVPDHPIVEGVGIFDGGSSSFRPTTPLLTDHGVPIARWSDGRTLVAVSSRFPTRVDLGMYPPSSDSSSSFWVAGTDGARLMANALLFAASAGAACRPDFNGDGFLDFFDFDEFVACFEGGSCPPGKSGDYNDDGFADFFDYDEFVADFEAGC